MADRASASHAAARVQPAPIPNGRPAHSVPNYAVLCEGPLHGSLTDRSSLARGYVFGARPHTEWLAPEVLRDRWGSVITGPDVLAEGGRRAWLGGDGAPAPLESSVPGFFAVGDVRRGSVKRVASAVGEGSVVISSVHAYLGAHAGG